MHDLDALLQLITLLRNTISVTEARRMLLEYICSSTHASFALICTVDASKQALVPLACSGFPALAEEMPDFLTCVLPLDGLFASALSAPGLISVPDMVTDPRTLAAERIWHIFGSSLVLCSISHNALLILFFQKSATASALDKGNLLLCATLLSSYLTPTPVQPAEVEPVSTADAISEATWAAELSQLYTLAMLHSHHQPVHKLYQQILAHVGQLLGASCTLLLLTQAEGFAAIPTAAWGDEALGAALITGVDMTETKPSLVKVGEHALLIQPLICEERSLGYVVSVFAASISFSVAQQSQWLTIARSLALLIRHVQLCTAEYNAAVDKERTRIARDIHDGPAQHLAHVAQKLDFVQRVMEKQPELAQREIGRARHILLESLNELRQCISSFVPVELEHKKFKTALQELIHSYAFNTPNLSVSCKTDDLNQVPSSLEIPVFRFIQEALNNVRKHAHATHVSIHIRISLGLLLIEVRDNGVGFEPEQATTPTSFSSRMGLRTMRQRVEEAGGHWEIYSQPRAGTVVKASFPLPATSSTLTSREYEVLRLMVEGLTNRAIAERLSVSPETIKSHVHHIMQKMHVHDRTQASVLATRQHWV